MKERQTGDRQQHEADGSDPVVDAGGRGVAVGTLFSGIANFAVSLTFLSLVKAVGSASTFALYGVLSIVTLIFVRFAVPETCGRELESISVPKAGWTAPLP